MGWVGVGIRSVYTKAEVSIENTDGDVKQAAENSTSV